MGFIPQTNTKTLYAYLTPKGRQYILDGNQEDFQVAFFSLHDDDVNYYISSNLSAGTTSTYYTLQSGFIPDITGDNDTCIKSIAIGTSVNMLSTLSGSTVIDPVTGFPTVGPISSSGIIGGRSVRINGPTVTTINAGQLPRTNNTYSVPFNVSLLAPSNDSIPLQPNEISNTQYYIKIIDSFPSSLIGNFTISGTPISIDTNFLYTPKSASETINISYSLLQIPSITQTLGFTILITPFNLNNTVTNGNIKYTAQYIVGNNGGDRGSDTTTPTTPPGTNFSNSSSTNVSSSG